MTTDRELLELAAKAAGIRLHVWGTPGSENFADINKAPYGCLWNPLTDDGDRYRLIQKLKAHIDFESQMVLIREVCIRWPEDEPNGERAIVRAAAEIGKAMP